MSSMYEAQSGFEISDEFGASGELSESSAPVKKPPVFVWGVAVLTLFFATQIMQLFPGLDGIPVAKIAVGAVILLFVFSPHLLGNRLRLSEIPQVKYLLLILLFAALTVPFSIWPSGSLSFIVEGFAKNVVFVYLLVQGARDERAARIISGAFVAGCALIVLAILTGFGPKTEIVAREQRLAVSGTYDVNDLALLFVVALPFAYFMLKDSSRLQRWLLLAAMALMLVGIIKSASRGGFLGLAVITALGLARSSRQARKYALLAILAGAVVIAAAAPAAYWARIGTIFDLENDYNMHLETGRKQIWLTGLKMIAARPLTGVGINCFPIAHTEFSDSKVNVSPHNSFLQIAAELGLPGITLFVLIIFVSMRVARRARGQANSGQSPGEFLWLASAIEVSFVGFIVSASLLTHAYSPIFGFLAGISASLVAHHRAIEKARQNEERQEVEYA